MYSLPPTISKIFYDRHWITMARWPGKAKKILPPFYTSGGLIYWGEKNLSLTPIRHDRQWYLRKLNHQKGSGLRHDHEKLPPRECCDRWLPSKYFPDRKIPSCDENDIMSGALMNWLVCKLLAQYFLSDYFLYIGDPATPSIKAREENFEFSWRFVWPRYDLFFRAIDE